VIALNLIFVRTLASEIIGAAPNGPILTLCFFSPSPPPREERVGVRRPFIFPLPTGLPEFQNYEDVKTPSWKNLDPIEPYRIGKVIRSLSCRLGRCNDTANGCEWNAQVGRRPDLIS